MNMTAMMEYTDDSYSQGERNLGSISKDGSHSHSSWGASDDDTDHTSVTETKRKPSSAKSEEMLKIEERSRKETRNLRAWRSILILVMISTGALTSVGTYLYIANQQRQEALDTYSLFTHTVKNASDKQVHDFRLGMMSMAATITSSGFKSTSNFPFISIPMFEVVGSYTRRLTRVDYVSWNPLVADSERAQWVEFVKKEIGWYEESKKVSSSTFTESFVDEEDHHDHQHFADFESNSTFLEDIWRGNRSLTDRKEIVANVGLSAPIWQCSPPPYSSSFLNYDMMSEKIIQDMLPPLQKFRSGLLSVSQDSFAQLPESFSAESDGEAAGDAEVRDLPHSLYVRPVFEGMDDSRSKVVGFLASVVPWDIFMSNLLPDGVKGITAVLKNTCNQSYTFVINGQQAIYQGPGDKHQPDFTNTEFAFPIALYDNDELILEAGHCAYSLSLYFSSDFSSTTKNHLKTISPIVMTTIFVVMAAIFCIYDRFVYRRNAKIVDTAARSNEILSSLFPSQVRDRLYAETERRKTVDSKSKSSLDDKIGDAETTDAEFYKSKPIADLFPATTILFADIVGFTAWSSIREPTQVFILLETIFRSFDVIAKKRRIFKVETVGDCYVAATGLPERRDDHAVAMARFASDCMARMRKLAKTLDVTLGPDTGDLAMRMGMHSGPVTAGVLRGERSRFQLFGDTMNTAARMESTGLCNKVQISQETADLLVVAGKSAWLSRRIDVVNAKGKGELQTYWLEVKALGRASSTKSISTGSECDNESREEDCQQLDDKLTRLIDWNADVLLRLLKQIVESRRGQSIRRSSSAEILSMERDFAQRTRYTLLDEAKEIVILPKFREHSCHDGGKELDPVIVEQLNTFVKNIAGMYHENLFHNFEHASHVAMSTVKLLSRIVAPSRTTTYGVDDEDTQDTAATLHDHTYGITSDPLTQFSCVLSALIHDVDHVGVPNAQLVQEGSDTTKKYNGRSVAEQNSLDLAWSLLLRPEYDDLRHAIYTTPTELVRFRQIVVNAVMATDIVDKDLKQIRNLRWDHAFSHSAIIVNDRHKDNHKATIVIEHLIQASDVSHTMQHWHIYRKWNERFFQECYYAYVDGRAEKNPVDSWYEGEIGFFDFYIIPLAKKLQDCGVFGVSSDEYLNYAIRNRQEWEKRGREEVSEMFSRVSHLKKAARIEEIGSKSNARSDKFFL